MGKEKTIEKQQVSVGTIATITYKIIKVFKWIFSRSKKSKIIRVDDLTIEVKGSVNIKTDGSISINGAMSGNLQAAEESRISVNTEISARESDFRTAEALFVEELPEPEIQAGEEVE